MRIFFLASEATPYIKTGGLADVAGALPKALKRRGHDVALILPRYTVPGIAERTRYAGFNIEVEFDYHAQTSGIHVDDTAEVPTFFIDAPRYFHRQSKSPYGEHDDAERFAYFCRAACELIRRLGPPPDVVQCNDWMTGLVPAHIRTTYGRDPFWERVGTLYTIHNMAFHGVFDPRDIPKFGFDPGTYRTEGGFEFEGHASMMKAALLSADMISTVSKRYAQEIQTPEFGYRLDGLLRSRARDVVGILNGVDYEHWDPRHDPHIAAPYWVDNLEGKLACKRDLLSRFWLPDEPQRPVFGIVSRLSDQKGIDLIAESVVRLIETGAFFIELGSGSREYEEMFQALRDTYPRSVGVYRGYSEPLAHVIEAGADFFLMPSRFEPCGLNQIYSLRYGTPPIVRATGGLDDTIEHLDRAARTGNGFKFYEYRADRLLETMYEALLVYRNPELLAAIRRNGMREDFSWDRSADEYERLFGRIAYRKHQGH